MSYGIMPYAVKMSEIVSDLQSKDEAVVCRLKSYCASEFSGEEELAELAFKTCGKIISGDNAMGDNKSCKK